MQKKILPIIAGVLVVVLVVAGFFIFKNRNKSTGEKETESSVPALSESQWPAISLTPTEKSDVSGSMGHWLNFKVEKINIKEAASMDYLLVYNTSDGGQQGVPGKVNITGGSIEKKLLLGSESSGKFRYDTGVETGTMTITFRNENGKMIGKLSTEFHLQTGVAELTSVDGVFGYTLDKIAKNVYFVTMKTYAQPEVPTVVWQNGYGVFSSDGKDHAGMVASE